ncbi:MAG: GNAT family N-acetyltransferase [Clostridia bacterium]|nr:GNAT family N-acetyltransferase [Clostridia bacterium]
MINIEYNENLDEEFYKIINVEFNKYAQKNDIVCNYTPFSFIAKEDGKIVGIITGHSYYKEVHIEDLIVLEEYRNKHIGSMLVKEVEEYFKNK